MPPLSAILVAVDFSAGSRTAVRVAALFAHRHAATLTLLHVDRMPEVVEREAMGAPADVWESYLAERAECARHLLEEEAGALRGISTRVAVASGDVPRAILHRAERDRSDLIVLGAHGAGTLHHLWLGSVPFEVAANTQVPALIVRERGAPPQSEGGFRRPLIAVGIGGPSDAQVAVATWLCADDAIFHFVHVSEWPAMGAVLPPGPKALEQALARRASWLRDEAARLRPRAVTHFDEAESTSESILERIERDGHDLVVVGQRAAPKPSGSVGTAARRLLEYANVSVALIPSTSSAAR